MKIKLIEIGIGAIAIKKRPGVYKIIAMSVKNPKKIKRVLTTDCDGIFYIGESGNLNRRLNNIRLESQKKKRVMNDKNSFHIAISRYNQSSNLKKMFALNKFEIIYYYCKNKKKAEIEEKRLLKKYLNKYGELPPLNKQ